MIKIEQLKLEKTRVSASLLQAILDDTAMSKLEKLTEIAATYSMPYEHYLVRPLEKKYADIFKKQIEEKYGVQSFHVIDSWPVIDCDIFNKGERISLPDQLEAEMENAAWDLVGDNPSDEQIYKQEIIVMKNRYSNAPDEYKITIGQLIDDVYEWVVINHCIGFHFDW